MLKICSVLLATVTVSAAVYTSVFRAGSREMTTTLQHEGKVEIRLAGSGKAAINWGDNSKNERQTLSDGYTRFRHEYSAGSIRNITITGRNIRNLDCYDNQLTSLDVNKNTALEILICSRNELTALDVSKNTALEVLICGNNQLTELDLSKNTALEYIDYRKNRLTELDLSKNTALTSILCSGNQLTFLDVSKNSALLVLTCSDNQLTSLDVNKNTELVFLDCEDNQLTGLNLSKNTILEYLYFKNNQFTSVALNMLFGTLHGNTIEDVTKTINIYGNPGTDTCDRSIAERKGWKVRTE